MVIVSQDKKRIVNFDNLTQVYITHCEEDNTGYFIRFETVDSLYEDIGEYATEERAKEVLQEIINLNIKFELYKTMPAEGNGQAIMLDNFSNNNIKFDTYEMPKE